MAVAGEPDGKRDLGDRPVCAEQKLLGPESTPLDQVAMRRRPGGALEGFAKMMRAQARNRREVVKADIFGQMRLDIVGDAPQAQPAEPADYWPQSPRPIAICAEGRDGGWGSTVEPLAATGSLHTSRPLYGRQQASTVAQCHLVPIWYLELLQVL